MEGGGVERPPPVDGLAPPAFGGTAPLESLDGSESGGLVGRGGIVLESPDLEGAGPFVPAEGLSPRGSAGVLGSVVPVSPGFDGPVPLVLPGFGSSIPLMPPVLHGPSPRVPLGPRGFFTPPPSTLGTTGRTGFPPGITTPGVFAPGFDDAAFALTCTCFVTAVICGFAPPLSSATFTSCLPAC
jgi:hypothetical protein